MGTIHKTAPTNRSPFSIRICLGGEGVVWWLLRKHKWRWCPSVVPKLPAAFAFLYEKKQTSIITWWFQDMAEIKNGDQEIAMYFLGSLGCDQTRQGCPGDTWLDSEKLWFAGKIKICTNLLQCDHVGRVPLPALNRVDGNIPQCDKGWKSIIAQTQWIAQLWFPIKSGKDISTGYALPLPSSLPEVDRAPYMLNTPFWRTNLKSHSLFACVVFF